MNNTPDIEVVFEFNNVRKKPAFDGYRPAHLVKDDYLTTGVHHYYSVDTVAPGETVVGSITFITPELYLACLWVGKKLSIQEGDKIVGFATITKIFNSKLDINQ